MSATLTGLTIRVRGIPVGQPRPRARNAGKHARVYNPGTSDDWKEKVIIATRIASTGSNFDDREPLIVKITYLMPRPKSHFGAHGLLPSAPRYHLQKPDLDNLDKAVLDALVVSGIMRDDCQVVQLISNKDWTKPGEDAGAWIAIEAIR